MKFPNIKQIVSNVLWKKQDNSFQQLSFPSGNTFSMLWNSLNSCGNIRINKGTMYEIHKTNKMAFWYSKKISQMVARNWLQELDKDWEVVENSQILEEVYKYIWGKSNLSLFVADFFDQTFCAWQVFGVPSKINGFGIATADATFKILDSRGITVEPDKYGNVKNYSYTTSAGRETFWPMSIVDYIAYRDVDIKYQWLSIYNSIVMNALTNSEAWRTQMYYFKNDATPNTFLMLNPEAFRWVDGAAKKEEFDRQRNMKYSGATGSGKTHSSHIVTDIKTLDISNVDLDLINLTKENDMAFSAIFLLDARLIWLQKDTGSYGEVESTTIRQGNDQISAYWEMFSDFITQMYVKFINPSFEWTIAPINSKFKDINKDKEIWLKETAGGVLSVNEYRKKFDYELRPEPEYDDLKKNTPPTPAPSEE